MAVLLNRRSFVVILLVATYEMKVIWDFCVIILVNFWIIFLDVSIDLLCRAKKYNFLIRVWPKCVNKLNWDVTVVTVLSTVCYIILLYILLWILVIVITFTLIILFYIHKKNRKYNIPSSSLTVYQSYVHFGK